MPTFRDDEDRPEFNEMLKIDAAHDEPIEEHPCAWCNDEGSEDGDGEVHPCAFCGAC